MAVNKRVRADVEMILETSLASEFHTALSEDPREAKAAFVEKRDPVFKGR